MATVVQARQRIKGLLDIHLGLYALAAISRVPARL